MDLQRTGRRLDVEGLRAVAVLAVVLFHSGVPGVDGGYVGVDVFYVISGFLITGLLRREIAATGRVSLPAFYARRARRILPAATLVLVVTVAVSAAVMSPLRLHLVAQDALACALFVGNWRFAAVGTDYLAGSSAPSPLLHYWSLGVEEQFYLVWPVLVLLGTVLGRRWRPALPLALALVTAASFLLGWRWTTQSPPEAFFTSPARAWELGVGGLTALAAAGRPLPTWARTTAGWCGLAAIAVAVFGFSGSTPFPGVLAAIPVLGAALVLLAGSGRPAGPTRLLSITPLVRVGRVSYGWYLWHWPPLVLLPVVLGEPLTLTERLVVAAASLLAATASLLLLEDPVRSSGRLRRRPRASLTMAAALVGGGVTAALIAGQLLVAARQPSGPAAAPIRLQPPLPPATSTGSSPSGSPAPVVPAQVAALTAADEQVGAAVAASLGDPVVPSNLVPPLQDAEGGSDKAEPFLDGCDLSWSDTEQPPCAYTPGSTKVVLFGDSHAAQWFPAMQTIAQQHGWQLQSWTKTTCPPAELSVRSPYLGRQYTECDTWRSAVLGRIRAEKPALVVLGVSPRYGTDFDFQMGSPQWYAALTRTVTDIRATGAQVLLIGPVPDPHVDVPQCLSAHPDDVAACSFPLAQGIDPALATGDRAAVLAAGGQYLDITPWFCTAERCAVIVGPVLVYRDDNHISVPYARWLTPPLEDAIDAVTAGEPLPS